MRYSFQFPRLIPILFSILFISTVPLAADVNSTTPLPNLRDALHTNAASAAQAAAALAKMGPAARSTLPDLIDALRFDEDSVTAPVGDALLAIGPEAVEPLTLCLKDSNLFVRQRAAIILGRFGPKAKSASHALAVALLDANFQVSTAAGQALLKIGPDALPSMISLFNDQDEKGQLALMDVMGGIGAPATPFLLKTLSKSEDIFVRVKACELLGTIRPASPEVVSGLMDTMNNMDERVRLSAVEGLQALGDQAKAAIGALIVASQTDSDPLVRQKALETLTTIGTPTAASLPGLGRALHSPEGDVRSAVVAALASCKEDPTHTLALLQVAAHDGDPAVQSKAQAAIAKLQSAAPAPAAAPAKH